jgi:hypothetical protein
VLIRRSLESLLLHNENNLYTDTSGKWKRMKKKNKKEAGCPGKLAKQAGQASANAWDTAYRVRSNLGLSMRRMTYSSERQKT